MKLRAMKQAELSRKNAEDTRGRPCTRGNPGRPPGSRNKASLAVDLLLDGEAEALTRKAIEMALEGDTVAMRLCLDRIAPPRKDRPTPFSLPDIAEASDIVQATRALIEAVAVGELTPMEASDMAKLVD